MIPRVALERDWGRRTLPLTSLLRYLCSLLATLRGVTLFSQARVLDPQGSAPSCGLGFASTAGRTLGIVD